MVIFGFSVISSRSRQTGAEGSYLFSSNFRTVLIWVVFLLGGGLVHADMREEAAGLPERQRISSSPPVGADKNLANQATNPASALIQLQLQNVYAPSVNNASGSSNRFVI